MSGDLDSLSLTALPAGLKQTRLARFLVRPGTRYALAWLLALGLAAGYLIWAWNFFNDPRRPDGNLGHVFIDFGGQWLMGRMIVEGHGKQLYHRGIQREAARRAYPRSDEVPAELRQPAEQGAHDAEDLVGSFMGADDPPALASVFLPLGSQQPLAAALLTACAQPEWHSGGAANRLARAFRPVGGPLYPPVQAVLFWPMSLLAPQPAYRLSQVANIAAAFLSGLAVSVLLRGRIWWPIAAAAVILYPGFPGSICLGQNAALTLCIVVWGWALLARGWAGLGGAVWGLLAYKPVWALAFFLVPLLTGRWRMMLGMAAAGTAVCALTIPIVGLGTWLDWLDIGKAASNLYNVDPHWVFLSRDLLSIPRRWLLDFAQPPEARDRAAAAVIGWTLLLAVLAATALLALRRRQEARAVVGVPPAFLFLGAWLGCFHFMYYDVLLTALPIFLLSANPAQYLRPVILLGVPLESFQAANGSGAMIRPNPRSLWLVNNVVLTIVGLLLVVEYILTPLNLQVFVWAEPLILLRDHVPLPLEFTTNLMGTPWHTFLLMALWLWCGWLWTAHGVSADVEQKQLSR